MGELADLRAKVQKAMRAADRAEDEWLDSECAEHDDSTPEYRRLVKANKAEQRAHEELHNYLLCPVEGHSEVCIYNVDAEYYTWCKCIDCLSVDPDAPIGRGNSDQEAFDDFHERMKNYV